MIYTYKDIFNHNYIHMYIIIHVIKNKYKFLFKFNIKPPCKTNFIKIGKPLSYT